MARKDKDRVLHNKHKISMRHTLKETILYPIPFCNGERGAKMQVSTQRQLNNKNQITTIS